MFELIRANVTPVINLFSFLGIAELKPVKDKNKTEVSYNLSFLDVDNKKNVVKIEDKARGKTVEKAVEKILSFIKENPAITQNELKLKTGLTRRGIEWNLKKLKDHGILRRIGPDKGGHWEIPGSP